MGRPLVRSRVCPVLIGRDPHLVVLRDLIDEVKRGVGQTILVVGEAGVGKTRLLAEATSYAVAHGYELLQGTCFQADRGSPYAPLLDLLRAYFSRQDATTFLDNLGPSAAALGPLLSEVLPLPTPPPPLARFMPTQEKLRLFSGLIGFFLRRAALGPTLLVVEDLHWSDDTSLEFLYHLARRCSERALLVLLTCRNDEQQPRLRQWLAQLDHDRLTREISLPSLNAIETRAMIRAIIPPDQGLRADFLNAVFTLTEGNPFFIEEVLGSVARVELSPSDDGVMSPRSIEEMAIPQTIDAAVKLRSEGVSEAARHLANLAAVTGRRFDLPVLQRLTHYAESRLLALVKELISAQLVLEESGDRFVFRHALTREAIYAGLLVRERQRLHRQVAEAISQEYAGALDPHLGDLADHWYHAGAWEQALTFAWQAGERAIGLYAPREAITQLCHALEAAERLGIAVPSGIWRRRGQAHEWIGEFDAARRDYEAELARARLAREPTAEWQALLDLGLLWAGANHERSLAYDEQALAVARANGTRLAVAHSLNRLGNWHVNADDPQAGERCHQEALSVFRAIADRSGLAETLDLLGMAACLGGNLDQSAHYYRRAIALFEEMGDRRGLVSSLATMTVLGGSPVSAIAVKSVAPSEAVGAGERALRIAREIGWRTGEAYSQTLLGAYLGTRGEYDQALPLLQGALGIAEEVDHRSWTCLAHSMLGMVYLDLLALPQARWHLEQALALARTIGFAYRLRSVAGNLARVYVAARHFPLAHGLLGDVLWPNTPAATLSERLCSYAQAELALATGKPEQALAIADRLTATDANLGTRGEQAVPRLARLRGEALTRLRRTGEAEVALQAARAGSLAEGAKPLLWRVDLALGCLYRAESRSDDAEHAFAAARTTVEELAVTLTNGSVRKSFLAGAATQLPGPRPLAARRATWQAFDGLTNRECDVAALIAGGRMNQQIADELVVSKRTIETHIGSVMSKLGYTSRAQVAVWADRKGLARTPR